MNQAELFFPQPVALARPAAVQQAAPAVELLVEFDEAGATTQSTYSVRLADCQHPTGDFVKVAEQRFRRELDRRLGDDVLPAQRAYLNVTESSEGELTKDDVVLATRWVKAYDAARSAGSRDLGDVGEAYFEVKPA